MEGSYKITRIVQHTGDIISIKVGLDSGTIINILHNPILFNDILEEILKKGNILHIHAETLREVPAVLERDYNWSIDDANSKLKGFIDGYNVKIVPKNRNNPLYQGMREACEKENINFHPPDAFIVADFKLAGINKVYSGDNSVVRACNFFGMIGIKTPTVDRKLSEKLRDIFRRPKVYRK